jgi:ketosteroid isomerase-like protein
MRHFVLLKATCLSGLVLAVGCGGGDTENKGATAPTTTTSATPPPTASSVATITQPPPKPPLAELVKKTLADFDVAFAGHDATKCAAAYASDAVYVQPGPLGWNERHKDEIQKSLDNLFKSFPDVKLTPTRTFIKGNMVAVEGVMTGTHTGDFMGHAATGKKIGGRYFSLISFNDDGLISKEHLYHDHAAMLGHLGKGDPKLHYRNVENIPTTTLEQISPGDNTLESKNETAARAWLATFEKKDDKAYLAGISDDITHADYTRPEDVKGKDAAKKAFAELLKTFPDIKMTPMNVVAIGDYVIAEVEMSGTMKGDLGSVKSNGKSGTVHIVDVLRYNKDGKIAWAGRWGSRMEFANAFGVPARLPAMTTTAPPAKK